MKLFPAIDIMGGKCVRLLYGEKEKVTVYGDAVEMAKKWASLGAEYLHVVDLDGAFSGAGSNLKIVASIVKNVNIPIQLGGGIRTIDDVKERLDSVGVSRVILGTSAVKEPKMLENAVNLFGDKIACGIDAKNGFVSIKGWTEEVSETPIEFGKKMFQMGIKTVIYTDISRDGALTGVNVDATHEMQAQTKLNVIASGGVSNIQDIKKLKEKAVYGAILGKALYTNNINLEEALCLAKG